MSDHSMFGSVDSVTTTLAQENYISTAGLSTSLFLAVKMGKALFLEGEPGVGKTEIAKVLSSLLQTPLIRLQCYEGLDINHAVYEWNYPYQLLAIQSQHHKADVESIFTEKYLLKRPLLQSIDQAHEQAPILLIDEIDRADEEFESFLLEILAEFQITIPEIGTFQAKHRPITIITSNRTREIHDALKRRCVYFWIDYPPRDREIEIVRRKVPGISERLSEQIVDFIHATRQRDLYKVPGVAETLDWAQALSFLNQVELTPDSVGSTLGMFLKYQDDVSALEGEPIEQMLEQVVG